MTAPSVETNDPPAQDVRAVIDSWRTEGYRIWLEDAGANGATIFYRSRGGPQEFGRIAFDTGRDRHIITWNRAACLTLEEFKRNHWDTRFYYAMAQWMRGAAK